MNKKYYILAVCECGERWVNEFSDYDKETVKDERDELYYSWKNGFGDYDYITDMKVITLQDAKQTTVDAKLIELDKGLKS